MLDETVLPVGVVSDGRRRISVSVSIDKELWQEVRELAEKEERTISVIVRRALRDYLYQLRHIEDVLLEAEDGDAGMAEQ